MCYALGRTLYMYAMRHDAHAFERRCMLRCLTFLRFLHGLLVFGVSEKSLQFRHTVARALAKGGRLHMFLERRV